MKKSAHLILAAATLSILVLNACGKKDVFPPSVGSLQKYDDINGDCLNSFEQFIYNDQEKTNSETAYYSGDRGDVRILVKTYRSADAAEKAYKSLVRHFETLPETYVNQERVFKSDIKVWRCYGQGRTHYIYTRDLECVYISAATTVATTFLSDYFAYRY